MPHACAATSRRLSPLTHPEGVYRFCARGTGVEALHREARGHGDLRTAMKGFIESFRFEEWRELSLVIEGDRAALYWQAKVTSPATGKSEVFEVADFIRIRDGKIAELIQFTDTALLGRL